MNTHGEGNQTAFLDLLFLCLLGVTYMFVLSFLQIAAQSKQEGIQHKAEFVVTLSWPDRCRDDVDLWMRDPTGDVMSYFHKEINLMHLDRDDLGAIKDEMILLNGERVSVSLNQEIATIRGNIPGNWIVNLHMYRKRDQEPTDCIVKVEKLNPSVKLLALRRITLSKQNDEATVVRLMTGPDGEVLMVDDGPFESLIKGFAYGGIMSNASPYGESRP